MSQQTTPSRILSFAALFVGSIAAKPVHPQAYTPPPPPLTTAPCVPTKKNPCTDATPAPPPAKDKFAFPGDAPDTATLPPPSAAGDSNPSPSAPAPNSSKSTPPPSPKSTPADSGFPFPGEPPSGLPTSSSSSSSSGSSSTPDSLPGDDPAPSSSSPRDPTPLRSSRRRKLAKVEDPDTRATKDLDVARFYLDTGNFLGAYNRAKDALRLYPDDPEAHFAVAAAAQKLKKNEEAIAEYHSYLRLEPDGDHVKVARQALTEIH